MDSEVLASWWTTLNDRDLSGLIDRAVAGNLDVKKATARVRQARASRLAAKAGFFPAVEAAGSAVRNYSNADAVSDKVTDLYSANFDAVWELDIFGGIRRSVEAAGADLEAAREDLRDVLVSLLGEVARNYVDVRSYQVRIEAAGGNIAMQSETYQLTLWRQQAGLGDELAVQEALSNLESARSQLPDLRSGLEGALNRIAVLLGEQPGKVHKELEKRAAIPSPTPMSCVLPPTCSAAGRTSCGAEPCCRTNGKGRFQRHNFIRRSRSTVHSHDALFTNRGVYLRRGFQRGPR